MIVPTTPKEWAEFIAAKLTDPELALVVNALDTRFEAIMTELVTIDAKRNPELYRV